VSVTSSYQLLNLVKKRGFIKKNKGTPSFLSLWAELASELNKKRFPFSSRGAIAEDGAEKCESEEEPFWPYALFLLINPHSSGALDTNQQPQAARI
jgi:hypothetical protein